MNKKIGVTPFLIFYLALGCLVSISAFAEDDLKSYNTVAPQYIEQVQNKIVAIEAKISQSQAKLTQFESASQTPNMAEAVTLMRQAIQTYEQALAKARETLERTTQATLREKKALEDLEDAEHALKISEIAEDEGTAKNDQKAIEDANRTLSKVRTEMRVGQVTDEQLDLEIERAKKTLEQMGNDFKRNVKELQEWLRMSQKAREEALYRSLKLLTGSAAERLAKLNPEAYENANLVVRNGLRLLEQAETLPKLNPKDRESMLNVVRLKLQQSYEIFSEAAAVAPAGPNATALATFAAEYAYDASAWAVSQDQIHTIIDNLDKPGGALDAQNVLKDYYEILIQERNHRKPNL